MDSERERERETVLCDTSLEQATCTDVYHTTGKFSDFRYCRRIKINCTVFRPNSANFSGYTVCIHTHSQLKQYNKVLLRQISRSHLDYIWVTHSTQHLKLMLGVVSSDLQWEELSSIHLLGGIVQALVHSAIGTSIEQNEIGKRLEMVFKIYIYTHTHTNCAALNNHKTLPSNFFQYLIVVLKWIQ